jgi:hypothetical protein
MTAILKKNLGDGGAGLDSSQGSSTLYDVLNAVITDSKATISEVNAVSGSTSVVTQFNQLLADHNTLVEQFNQLLADHNTLQGSFDLLVADYNAGTPVQPSDAAVVGVSTAEEVDASTAEELDPPGEGSGDLVSTVDIE